VSPYWFAYTNDMAGNRLRKVQKNGSGLTIFTTVYTYDVQEPETYGSQGNRLVKTEFYEGTPESGSPVGNQYYYLYDKGGRVNYVVAKELPISGPSGPEGPQYTGTQIFYNTQGLIWAAWKMRWHLTPDGQSVDESTIEYLAVMEYRYESPRSRYRLQRRNATPGPITFFRPLNGNASEGVWSDYAGDSIHGDYSVAVSGSSATVSDTMAQGAGLGHSPWSGGALSANGTHYLHGNLIGSTETVTDSDGSGSMVSGRRVYTAFGEPVFSSLTPQASSRFGYAGAWGYQGSAYTSGDPLADLGWLHVGARYYDPASGRFVQRDPIGIRGGFNTYVYCSNNPLFSVDPSGESALFWIPVIVAAVAVALFLLTHCGYILDSPGRNWLDDPNSVRNVSLGLTAAGTLTGLGALGLGALGVIGGAGVGAGAGTELTEVIGTIVIHGGRYVEEGGVIIGTLVGRVFYGPYSSGSTQFGWFEITVSLVGGGVRTIWQRITITP
jgi:RHS repeat-associated protein